MKIVKEEEKEREEEMEEEKEEEKEKEGNVKVMETQRVQEEGQEEVGAERR